MPTWPHIAASGPNRRRRPRTVVAPGAPPHRTERAERIAGRADPGLVPRPRTRCGARHLRHRAGGEAPSLDTTTLDTTTLDTTSPTPATHSATFRLLAPMYWVAARTPR
ncbi:hypothetical protein NWFMUON74_33270 [Nocardia wallacei]|uniref:Uncharacterized protein n=1 Tax=Nocardia wallacei TaxID=480035 RepID=A0A7G1KJX9_9NOCA|nr:hypothetical protein NWFMUON74_33270 [Nocardia wallacei]